MFSIEKRLPEQLPVCMFAVGVEVEGAAVR